MASTTYSARVSGPTWIVVGAGKAVLSRHASRSDAIATADFLHNLGSSATIEFEIDDQDDPFLADLVSPK